LPQRLADVVVDQPDAAAPARLLHLLAVQRHAAELEARLLEVPGQVGGGLVDDREMRATP
jgi:hypothetical protein